jgi:hypothetical protein
MSNPRPNHRAEIMAALLECGPMTAEGISNHLDLELHKVNTAIASARYQAPGVFFRVVRYLPITGRRARDACVLAAEPGADLPRTKLTAQKLARRRQQAKTRYHAKNRATENAKSTARKAALTGRAVASNPWLQLAAPNQRAAIARMTGGMGGVA